MVNCRFGLAVTVLSAGILLGSSLALAQEGSPVDQIRPGSVALALGHVPLREAPPAPGLFSVPGKQAHALQRGDRVAVHAVRVMDRPAGNQVWIGVRRGSDGAHGWAYAGEAGRRSNNFRLER